MKTTPAAVAPGAASAAPAAPLPSGVPAAPSGAAPVLPAQGGPSGDAAVAAPSGSSEPVQGVEAAAAAGAPAPPAQAPDEALPRPPVAPSHDSERPVAPVVEEPSYTGFSARLSLGVGGALWFSGGDTKLSRPVWFGLDLGYAIHRSVVIIARASSWFPSDQLANEFFGAGAVYRLVADGVYVAGALGLSLTRVGPTSDWSHYVQGLALEADVGQSFAITTHLAFSVGAHFQFGSPFLGKKPDAFTSLQAGIFVAFGLR